VNYNQLQISYLELKRRLSTSVGAKALPEITVAPPHGTNDELSFIRLVIWGYVLLQESGKTAISFLRQLPPWNSDSSTLLPHVRALRTWTSHNLSFEKVSDIKTIEIASYWFREQCGTGSPSTAEHWNKCFTALATDLHGVLLKAITACDCFDQSEDRQKLIAQFDLAINRTWEAYRFDKYAVAAIEKFGYDGLEASIIRAANLEAWRKIVTSSIDEKAIEKNLTLRIESDILKLMGDALPLTSVMAETLFKPKSTTELVAALILIKNCNSDRESLIEIFERLAKY
jgi:hypothetical protein